MKAEIFESIEELNDYAARKFIEIGNEVLKKRNQFTVALAGGSTPKALYRLLASDKFRDKIDWNSVFFFFGDERNVLPGDEESNFRMANENLFQLLEIHQENIFHWNTEFGDERAIAEDYESKIIDFFEVNEGAFPAFDLILLGMGDDGHTASLFPNTSALSETQKIAAENWVAKLNSWRFTLTFPAINNAANIFFLVKGEDKAEILKKVLEGEFQPQSLPAQNIRPESGNLHWLIDSAAASKLLKNKN